MSSPASHRVWHVIYSWCVPALSALTVSTFVVAAQSAPSVAAQPEAAASPAVALAYLGTVSGGFPTTFPGGPPPAGRGVRTPPQPYSRPPPRGGLALCAP